MTTRGTQMDGVGVQSFTHASSIHRLLVPDDNGDGGEVLLPGDFLNYHKVSRGSSRNEKEEELESASVFAFHFCSILE